MMNKITEIIDAESNDDKTDEIDERNPLSPK